MIWHYSNVPHKDMVNTIVTVLTLVTAISLSRKWLPGRKTSVVLEVRGWPCAYSCRESETGLCRTWYVKSWFDMVRIYSLTEWLIAIHVCNIYKKP